MPSTGLTLCGRGQSAGGGDEAWLNPDNISTAGDGTQATCTPAARDFTDSLRADQFGFAVAGDITEITVRVRKSGSSGNDFEDDVVKLFNGTTTVGAGKGTSDTWPTSPTDVDYTWSEAELTTAGITAAIVNLSGFGIEISAEDTASGSDTAKVSEIEMNVTYSGGAANTGFFKLLGQMP